MFDGDSVMRFVLLASPGALLAENGQV